MTAYKFRIEAGFVRLPGQDSAGTHGFVCTIYAQAGSARQALQRAARSLEERMAAHGVAEMEGPIYRTTCVVLEFWEVEAATYGEYAGKDTGFTFFRIGPMSAVHLWLRFSLMQMFRSHLIVDVHPGPRSGTGDR